ncbi:MAG: hypothetical protein NE327_19375 [Lentisphaeraceae bacterium]|nr:hypothetical protein [Lentisphaeraceae bacterium]
MIFKKIIEARGDSDGEIRCSYIVNYGSLNEALKCFGLFSKSESLKEVKYNEAAKILSSLLQKTLAYGSNVMNKEDAEVLTNEYLFLFSKDAIFYTNGSWSEQDLNSWTSFTDFTFDAGVIVKDENRYSCIWLVDED